MKKNNLSKAQILNKKFKTEISGYSSSEVDLYFDQIIEDYIFYDERIEALEMNSEDKTSIISELNDEKEKLQMELHNIKTQLKETEKATNAEMMKTLIDIKEEMKNKL
ncbi:MAG: DivIVA domain-containing protein [Mycoplasmataceae bacterium]|nr:DivIVA domain-containing protein [Mycoplasmataceae bacterium]